MQAPLALCIHEKQRPVSAFRLYPLLFIPNIHVTNRMESSERREKIKEKLFSSGNAPISAAKLARSFGVSRQIIVGDIALLRASGIDIEATPKGYILRSGASFMKRGRVVCLHGGDKTEEELNICVDNGCRVLDVIVEHPVYGQLTGMLDIATRYDVRNFMKKSRDASAHALYELTDGIHIHTLEYADDETFARTVSELDAAGLLYKES